MRKCFFTLLLLFAALVAEAKITGEYFFTCNLNGKIPTIIAVQTDNDGIAAGYIYYPKAKKPAPILLAGNVLEGGYIHMDEFQSDGSRSGLLTITLSKNSTVKAGTWGNPKGGSPMEMRSIKPCQRPSWFKSALTREDPQHIGKSYGYSIWNEIQKAQVGGHVTFRGAGKGKIHFEVCNVPRNIAEGQSEPGRPAVLDMSRCSFTYKNVNDCGYGFEAIFYKQFVVLRTVTDYDTLNCFGMGASFDGIYLKLVE